MKSLKRRKLLKLSLTLMASGIMFGCSSNPDVNTGGKILAKADESLSRLFEIAPDSQDIYNKAAGTLIIPVITKAGLFVGGSYGEGVLKIGGAPVDFYSVAAASFGYQAGAVQFSNVIFFMSEESLKAFRLKDGWEIGADAEVVFRQQGASLGVTNNTLTRPVYAIVFGQRGIIAGASLEGAKYSRLIR